MTQTPLGFDGTINEPAWSVAVPAFAGSSYGCVSGWAVTPVSGADRTVRITAGVGYTYAVRHESPTTNYQLPVVSAPTWFVVGWRLTWEGVGGVVKLDHIRTTSASSSALPDIQQQPGTTAFHPIACVQVTPNEALVTGIVDRRTWPQHVTSCTDLGSVKNPRPGEIALHLPSKKLYLRNVLNTTWDALEDPAPRWSGSLVSGAGGVTSGDYIAPGSYLLPRFQPMAGATLGMTATGGARWYFPSPGVYLIELEMVITSPTTGGSGGELVLFRNPGTMSPTMTDVPIRMQHGYCGSFLITVTRTADSYILGYRNTSSVSQRVWVTGSDLTITKVGEL